MLRLMLRRRNSKGELMLHSLLEHLAKLEARLPTLKSNLTTNRMALVAWIEPTSNRRWSRIREAIGKLKLRFDMLGRPLTELGLCLAEARELFDDLRDLGLFVDHPGVQCRRTVLNPCEVSQIQGQLKAMGELLTECRLERTRTRELWPIVRARVRTVQNQLLQQLLDEYQAPHAM